MRAETPTKSFDGLCIGDAVLIGAHGRIDQGAAGTFKSALITAMESSATTVIVDMSAVEDVKSAGFRSLVFGMRAAKTAGKTLALACLSDHVSEVFALSKMHLNLPHYPTVREAVAVMAPGSLAQFDAS